MSRMDQQKTEEGLAEQNDGETSEYCRTEKDATEPCLEDDVSLEGNIEEPLLVGNENESQTNEEGKDVSRKGDLGQVNDGKETEDFKSENEHAENTDGDEGVGSLKEDTSVSTDHEKTARLEDDIKGMEEDNIDLKATDVIESSTEKDEEDENKKRPDDGSAMEDGATTFIDEGLGTLEDEFTADLKDDSMGMVEDDADLKTDNEVESLADWEKEDGNKEEKQDGGALEDGFPSSTDESLKEVESVYCNAEEKDGSPGTSERNTDHGLEPQNEIHERRDHSDEEENCHRSEKDEGDKTEDEMGDSVNGYSLVSDSETLTPREHNFEIADSSLCDETNEAPKEDGVTSQTNGSLDEEILPEDNTDNSQGCDNGLLESGDLNARSDSETQRLPTNSEGHDDEVYRDHKERPAKGDQRQERDVAEEQEKYKDGDNLNDQIEDVAGRVENGEEQPLENLSMQEHQRNSNGEVAEPDEQYSEPKEVESGSHLGESLPDGLVDGGTSAGFYADDDLSSIFSDDGRDMATIVQENSILREAMTQLRNDNPGAFTDTISETSDEVDDFYPYPYGISGDSKILSSKVMADRDLNDAKVSELMREKRESQAKLRQLEREKAATERRSRQDKVERDFMEERFTLKASKLEEEIRNLKQENQRLKRGNPQGKGSTPGALNKNFGITKDPVRDLFEDNEDAGLPVKNGFASDIAMLAKENEKLSEIIDHLQETPGNDCFSEFVDTLDKYVPKKEYIKLENEKLKLETALREKERMVKEQERLLEETKFDLEEEIEILKENLKKAENKNKEKGKLLGQYDINMMEAKAKFTEKVAKLESRLDQEVSKKVKLEAVLVNLKKCNENFDKEIQGMKNRIKKLHSREAEMEKNRRDKAEIEGRLRQEAEEKIKLGRNAEALLQDLMELKRKLLEEAEKHRKEKEELKSEFENEKCKLNNAQENEHRRLMSELEDERRRNEQLKRRMAEIPGETIFAVMENNTETGMTGMFECPINDIEPGLMERAFRAEHNKEPDKDNIVTSINNQRDAEPSNVNRPLEESTGDVNKLQRRLVEVTKLNSIMQRRNKEIEEENINLKEKMERVGRDVSRLKELEDKNEEQQEEIARNAKKRNEMQRKQEDMMEEIEDISKKLTKVEGTNCDLSDEVEHLTKKIRIMEQEFAEEKMKLASSLEQEKTSAVGETEKRLDEQKERNKKLEREIDDLNGDIITLKEAKRAAEEKFVNDTKELVDRYNSELANERERYRQLQDELNNNAGTVRRVTEEWEQMLRNAVSRYEEDLQKNEDERRKMADDFQRQKDEMKSKFEKEKSKLERRIQENERTGQSSLELEVMPTSTEFSYQTPLKDTSEDFNGDLVEDKSHISNIIAEKHEKIRALAAQKQKLEQKLEQLQKSHDEEKNDLCNEHKKEKQKLEELTEDYQRRLEESKRRYEGLLEDQRRKHERENEEIENKFKREKQELEERLKHDFSSNLSSRSAGLENKIQDLVSQKVQEQKEITKRVELQMRSKLKEMQNEKNENKRKFEREKQVLEATIQALTKELAKVKQEKKDLKKKQKKDKAEMEEAFENEKREMKQIWEKCKIDTINQIEEEWSEKMKNEHTKLEIYKEELQESYDVKMKQLALKFKAEKAELEGRLAEAASETDSLAEAKKDIQAALEDEYRRKLQKEKENIESTLQGLRQEIARLQEHRKQLQNQMAQRENQAKTNAAPLLEANSKVGSHGLCWKTPC